MKIIISAQSDDIDSLVDPRFGRARWLVVANSENDAWETIDNSSNINASGGAGVQTSTAVAAHGAGVVITGNVGPNAHKVLAAAGVSIYRADNGVTVREALAAYRRGELTGIEAPTVAGHWA